MASVWIAPASGDLLNNGQPWRRGDVADIQIQLTTSNLDYIDIIGGDLPKGFYFNGGNKKIMGTLEAPPKTTRVYPVVFRVKLKDSTRFYDRSFRFIVNTDDEEQHWNLPTGLQDLGTVNRGSGVTIQLDIVNPDNDPLVYKAVGYVGPQGTYQGLPTGLEIDERGRIIGAPTITGNQPGMYYFKVYARDPDDIARNPHGEGIPRTSEKVYRITISQDIVLDARLSDAVRWETPSGSLGSTYETYASHFAVKASPQYEVSGSNSSENQMIRYTLTPKSLPLPAGLTLDPLSGLILGRCPYVVVSKTYEFIVEARVVFVNKVTNEVRLSSIASERAFSLTVRNIFVTDTVTSLNISVPYPARGKIAQWIWGNRAELRESATVPASKTTNELTIIGRNQLFRTIDPQYGKKRMYQILLVNGLNYTTGNFMDALKDYHHPTDLRIGKLQSAIARSPEGVHLYDVLYFGVIDPQVGAGGFDTLGREENLNRYLPGQKQTAIPKWNLTADNTHYYPNSIKNLRLDLINKTNRQPGQTGYGLSGKEGLPLWMMSEQIAGDPTSVLGYQCAIEVAYVKAGGGPAIVRTLTQAGINDDIEGTTVTVDRYLLLSDGTSSTVFDGPDFGTTDITTFDGPENDLTPTTSLTTFDTTLQSESKYYKFPPGDI